jgi:GT2 family glycosyltransferase
VKPTNELPADLAIIVVSTNEAEWLNACLRSVYDHVGGIRLDVVVVDNDSSDGTRDLVTTRFPSARVVNSRNRGFAHANNRGAMTCNARYVLFLNPDTEIVGGELAELVAAMDARPTVGLSGVRQLTGDGELTPTIRYFPSVLRSLGEAFGSEHWPRRWRWSGERELDLSVYDREVDCDWTSGSFMLARREALLSAGLLDERFFIYCEEPDLCLRMKLHGWDVRHFPTMTIIHHWNKAGVRPKMTAQASFARLQYAQKHFAGPRRAAYTAAEAIRLSLRCVIAKEAPRRQKREASRVALRMLASKQPPFGPPPHTAVSIERR